ARAGPAATVLPPPPPLRDAARPARQARVPAGARHAPVGTTRRGGNRGIWSSISVGGTPMTLLPRTRTAYFNGRFTLETDIVIPYRDRSFNRGDGCFD